MKNSPVNPFQSLDKESCGINMGAETMDMTYEKILDEQISLLFRKGSVITFQCGDQTQSIVLEDLDVTQLLNVQYILEQNAKNLREKILCVLPIWHAEKTWEAWREANRQLDMITNYLACQEC